MLRCASPFVIAAYTKCTPHNGDGFEIRPRARLACGLFTKPSIIASCLIQEVVRRDAEEILEDLVEVIRQVPVPELDRQFAELLPFGGGKDEKVLRQVLDIPRQRPPVLLKEPLLDDPVLVDAAADLALQHLLIGGEDGLQQDVFLPRAEDFG